MTMALILGSFLRNQRIIITTSLKRNFQISKAHLPRPECHDSCLRRFRPGPILWRNGRDVRFHTAPKSFLPRDLTGLSRCGHFHTSATRRSLPAPLVWMVLKPLQKLMAVILGRGIRKWWAALPNNRRQLLFEWMWLRRWKLAMGAGVTLVIVAVFILTHLEKSPITGRTRLLVFSKEKYVEIAVLMSNEYKNQFGEQMLPVSDPRRQVVEQVIQHLVQRNKDIPEISEVEWTVNVVQDPKINACVFPDGSIFVFTGLLEAITDVHQLTIVLGHEMAHALLGHNAEKANLSHLVDLVSVILLTAIWAICPSDSIAVVGHWAQQKLTELMFNHPYSRKLETEADEVGLQLAAKACADVRAGPVFWQQIEMQEQQEGEVELPEWLGTHPSHKSRYTHMDLLMPQAIKLRENCVCPALPKSDPRIVFSKSVHLLLEDAKNQVKSKSESELKPWFLNPGSSHPTAALMALMPEPPTLPAGQECKVSKSENGNTSSVVTPGNQ